MKRINIEFLVNGEMRATLKVDGMPAKLKDARERISMAKRLELIITGLQDLKGKVIAGEDIPSFIPAGNA